jgi:sigma-B regulation protein RsbQ
MKREVLRQHHVTVMGDTGPALVLAHGFGCDQRIWRHVAADLCRDHRVVLFDHVGSGRSDATALRADHSDGLDAYKFDVLNILEALELGAVTFIGHSISSSIGLLASIDQPARFENLILVGPSPRFINDGGYEGGFERTDIIELLDLMDRNVALWANFFAPIAVKNDGKPELVAEMRASLCSGDPTLMRQFAQVVFFSDIRSRLGEVTVPTLIMQCRDDTIAPASVGHYMQERISGSTLRMLAATGHCPHLSHPEETSAVIRDFLGCSAIA